MGCDIGIYWNLIYLWSQLEIDVMPSPAGRDVIWPRLRLQVPKALFSG
jgi:hypothetical protein